MVKALNKDVRPVIIGGGGGKGGGGGQGKPPVIINGKGGQPGEPPQGPPKPGEDGGEPGPEGPPGGGGRRNNTSDLRELAKNLKESREKGLVAHDESGLSKVGTATIKTHATPSSWDKMTKEQKEAWMKQEAEFIHAQMDEIEEQRRQARAKGEFRTKDRDFLVPKFYVVDVGGDEEVEIGTQT